MKNPSYLRKIETNNYVNEHTFWLLISIFGEDFIKLIIEENGGIVNNKVIEDIAKSSTLIWILREAKNGYILECKNYYNPWNSKYPIDEFNSFECIKRYKLEWMEDAIERTYTYIPLEFERNRKLDGIL